MQRLQHFLANEERFRLKDLKIFTENKVELPIKDEDEMSKQSSSSGIIASSSAAMKNHTKQAHRVLK